MKHLLVRAGDPDAFESTLKTAFLAAQRFDAHMSVVHYRPLRSCVVPMPVSTEAPGIVITEISAEDKKLADERAGKDKKIFDRFARLNDIVMTSKPSRKTGVTASFKQIDDYDADGIMFAARVADIAVLPRTETNFDIAGLINAVLTKGGVPVLLPPLSSPETIGAHIAVAWDGSAEAAKAVAGALSFLKQAQTVTVYETALSSQASSGEALVAHLAFHHVNAEMRVVKNEGVTAAATTDALMQRVCAGNDLLVAGAYAENTLKRLILGDATAYLINRADIALFLAH